MIKNGGIILKATFKKLGSIVLAAIMVLSFAVSSSAASITVPTNPLSTDDNVIKATAARAGQIAPLILGCNLVATSALGANTVNIFGSDINAIPDPYVYNYNYNENYAAKNGKEKVANAMIPEQQADGTPATPEAALNILTHRPDLILNQGAGTGNPAANKVYAEIVTTLPENTDSDPNNDYAPYFYTCSISTLVYQCENLINLSKRINEICEEKGLVARYGDPYEIATDYDKYVWGYYFYIKEMIDNGTIQKKSAVVVSKTSDEGANWEMPTLGTSVDQGKPNRLVEYVRDNTTTLNGATAGTAPLADVLACDVVVAVGQGKALRDAAAAAGVKEADLPLIIDTLPTCLYGMTMQTHENALGIPFIQSIIYADELGLNPVYAAAYFYQNFFHITDNAALQEAASTLLETATLPKGITTSLNLYDPKAIEDIIIEGARYATTKGLFRHDDKTAWRPDMTVGIGKAEPVIITQTVTNTVTNNVTNTVTNTKTNTVTKTEEVEVKNPVNTVLYFVAGGLALALVVAIALIVKAKK